MRYLGDNDTLKKDFYVYASAVSYLKNPEKTAKAKVRLLPSAEELFAGTYRNLRRYEPNWIIEHRHELVSEINFFIECRHNLLMPAISLEFIRLRNALNDNSIDWKKFVLQIAKYSAIGGAALGVSVTATAAGVSLIATHTINPPLILFSFGTMTGMGLVSGASIAVAKNTIDPPRKGIAFA